MMGVLREEGAIPAPTEECLEKRVYYKIISGLHASISTHLCHEFFNQSTGEWVCFETRSHESFCSSFEYRGRIYNVSFLAWLLILNGCSIFTLTRYSSFVLWLASALTFPHTTTARLEHMRKMFIRWRNWIRLLTSQKESVNSMSRSFSEGKTQMCVLLYLIIGKARWFNSSSSTRYSKKNSSRTSEM